MKTSPTLLADRDLPVATRTIDLTANDTGGPSGKGTTFRRLALPLSVAALAVVAGVGLHDLTSRSGPTAQGSAAAAGVSLAGPATSPVVGSTLTAGQPGGLVALRPGLAKVFARYPGAPALTPGSGTVLSRVSVGTDVRMIVGQAHGGDEFCYGGFLLSAPQESDLACTQYPFLDRLTAGLQSTDGAPLLAGSAPAKAATVRLTFGGQQLQVPVQHSRVTDAQGQVHDRGFYALAKPGAARETVTAEALDAAGAVVGTAHTGQLPG